MFAFGQKETRNLRRVIELYADERIMPASELQTVTGYEVEAFASVLENWPNDLDKVHEQKLILTALGTLLFYPHPYHDNWEEAFGESEEYFTHIFHWLKEAYPEHKEWYDLCM